MNLCKLGVWCTLAAFCISGCRTDYGTLLNDAQRVTIVTKTAAGFSEIGSLDKEGIASLQRFCSESESGSCMYVMHLDYLEGWSGDRRLFRWGLAGSGGAMSLDVTADDVSVVPASAWHRILTASATDSKDLSAAITRGMRSNGRFIKMLKEDLGHGK